MPSPHDPPALLAARITATPDAPALADEGGVLTWAQLGERVNRWRALLAGAGVSSGDAVALMLGNRREALEALLACLHAGITVVPVNWHLTAPEVAYLLTDADARLLVVDPPRAEVGAKAAADAGTVTALVTGDEVAYGLAAVEPLLAATDPSAAPAEQECGQLMIYTSGTTGRPKGVLNGLFVTGAPWARATRLLEYATGTLGVPTDGRVLLVGPWYHSAQLFFALLPLLNGATLVVRERFDPAGMLSTMDAERITECHLVPTQFVRLLRLDPAVRAGFSGASLRRIWHGGGPCPPDVKRRMIEWWGPVLVEYYAATEGEWSPSSTRPTGSPTRAAWAGRCHRTGSSSSTTTAVSSARTSRAGSSSADPAEGSATTTPRRRPAPRISRPASSPTARWVTSTTTATCTSPAAPRT